jgi:hypothetical protein
MAHNWMAFVRRDRDKAEEQHGSRRVFGLVCIMEPFQTTLKT